MDLKNQRTGCFRGAGLLWLLLAVVAMTGTAYGEERTDYFLTQAQSDVWRNNPDNPTMVVMEEMKLTPSTIRPGERVQATVKWRYRQQPDGFYNRGNIVYVTVFGDWQPERPLALLQRGSQGEPRLMTKTFTFTVPARPGTYRLRWAIVFAYAPVRNFYGTEPAGQHDPGIGPYADLNFTVTGSSCTPATSGVTGNDSGTDSGQIVTISGNNERIVRMEVEVRRRYRQAESWYQLGKTYEEARRFAEARRCFRLAGLLDGRQERYRLQAEGITAQAALEAVRWLDPRDDEFWGDIGDAFSGSNEPQLAVTCYRRARELDPADEEWKKKLEEHGDNGVGNGIDPAPPGNPPVNDDTGTGPGHPGNGNGNGRENGNGQGDGNGHNQGNGKN